MEDERVSPHDNCYSIVAVGQAVRGHEETLRVRKDPQAERQEKVDEITEVHEEVVKALSAIQKDANRHEVEKLCSVPNVEILRVPANEIATDENIEYTADEGYLFSQADCLGIAPVLPQLINALTYALSVSIKLFVRGWYTTAPLFDHTLFGILSAGFECFT